jgi:hypothetical protein
MKACTMSATQARPAVRARATARVVCTVAPMDAFKKVATGFGVGIASLALSSAAFAATVKLGADNGEPPAPSARREAPHHPPAEPDVARFAAIGARPEIWPHRRPQPATQARA